ncbi:hypothetical protein BD410DRAFT_714677 [Rickenella mellea]|uniref:Sfi1 spindle body domain-containing protein n=1 Tax=Rickenella mellea TaxID=50990 RepID=A0A4Y7QJV3_9AGAM|nr:hypothetical protein BD410DRAFT_714677 [Rickenella mellea]
MLSFQPRRKSSNAPQKPILDLSTTSSTASAALAGLSPQDVSLIDEIIKRSPPSATTFLTVFRAYNEVLQERGLDSGDDVMYYRILLKLGVVKGRNWGEKWTTVKSQMGYSADASKESQRPTQLPLRKDALRSARDTESFTIHSHQDLSEGSDAESGTSHDYREPAPYIREPTIDPRSDAPNTLRLRTEPAVHPRVSSFGSFSHVQSATRQYHDDTYSLVSDDYPDTFSPTPPSYRAATCETQSPHSLETITPTVRSRPPPAIVERKKAFIDEEEAWKQIKMGRDEEIADQFRDDKCVEKCWCVWLDGYRWISSTGWQVETARNNALTRTYLQQWRWCLSAQRDAFQQVARLAESRTLKGSWGIWKKKQQERKLIAWRNEMRVKMNLLKDKKGVKIKKDAWVKWRQLFQSRLSSQRYLHKLCIKIFTKWRYRKYVIDRMEALGDDTIETNELRIMTRYWEQWKVILMWKERERHVSSLVASRLRKEAMLVWKARIQEYRRADAVNDLRILKDGLRLWKESHARLVVGYILRIALNHVADKRKMRAVMHVWVARERGTLLQRVRDTRLVCLTIYVPCMLIHTRADQAQAFQRRTSSSVMTAVMHQWYQTRATHLNAYRFAARYYEDQLLYITVHLWRVKLRVKLRMTKQARIVRQFLLLNHALNVWRKKVKRQRALKLLELKLIARTFYELNSRLAEWRKTAAQQQNIQKMLKPVFQHVMKNAMSMWTSRVIDMKLRELQVVDRRDNHLLISAFEKWKSICMRHAEDLSLMLSYRDVKREETTRRMFYRWLTATRESRYRKSAHQQARSHDVKRSLSSAWDKWMDKTRDKQLKPLEHIFRFQLERNLLFRAFGMWNSKPNISKPASAIRFHASCLKSKHWKIWREAMPQALQARMARKHDRRNLLAISLDKWVQTYRTKVALKAVARAKYLRLPSKPDEVFTTRSRSSARSVISHKSSRSNSPAKDETTHQRRWPSFPDSDVVTSSVRRLSSASDAVRIDEQKNLWKELRLAQRGQNGPR